MSLFIVVLHVVVCIALILIVLLQTGKGADMGAAFGGGASQTLFGTTGASSFLTKMTTAAAVIFMLTSLVLAYMSGNRTDASSVIEQTPIEQSAPQTETAPAPAVPPAPESETNPPQATEQAPAAQESTPAPTTETPAADQNNQQKGTSE